MALQAKVEPRHSIIEDLLLCWQVMNQDSRNYNLAEKSLPVCLIVFLSPYCHLAPTPACWPTLLPPCFPAFPPFCHSAFPFPCLSTCLPLCYSVCLPFFLTTYQPACLSAFILSNCSLPACLLCLPPCLSCLPLCLYSV